jgi:hypothetical protein
MNTNNLSEETKEELIEFFSNTIKYKVFTKTIWHLGYIVAINRVNKKEPLHSKSEEMEQGYEWLSELAAILNPNFDV